MSESGLYLLIVYKNALGCLTWVDLGYAIEVLSFTSQYAQSSFVLNILVEST